MSPALGRGLGLCLGLALTGGCSGEAVEDAVLRGHVVIGHEVRAFEPCGVGDELWLLPGDELLRAHAELSRGPYGRVFAELRGVVEPPPPTGFGSDRAGSLRVLEVRRVEPDGEGHGCGQDLSGVAFRAAGNEPFWHVEVTPRAIVFHEPGREPLELPSAEPVRDGTLLRYETSAPGSSPRMLRLEVEPGRCTDSMVGSWYAWRARLVLDGRSLSGCAWEGRLAPGPRRLSRRSRARSGPSEGYDPCRDATGVASAAKRSRWPAPDAGARPAGGRGSRFPRGRSAASPLG